MSSSDESRLSGARPPSFIVKTGVKAAVCSFDESLLLVARPTRNVVSLWDCSKLCGIFFVSGVVFGCTLKHVVWKWASKLFRRSKDN